MVAFRYQGRKLDGTAVNGKIDAINSESAVEVLIHKGIIPLNLSLIKETSINSISLIKWLSPAVPLEVVILFSRQLFSLTKAGVPLLRAIRGLLQNCDNKQLKDALEEVVLELSNGGSLSAAMKPHRYVFSHLFVSMINVGENTGRLDEALMQLAIYYEQELATRKRIKEAMRYPSFVIIFIVIAMFILNILVIPEFATMFTRFGVELPLPTRILVTTSNFFVDHWSGLLIGMVALFLLFRIWLTTDKGRETFDKFCLRIPIVGNIVNRAQLSRFSRTFSLMLRSGVPLNQALALAAESLGNKFLEGRIMEMKLAIEAGSTISVTATNSQIFTPLVIQMIAVGEETGRIDELLLEVSDFYDREVDYDLKTLTARVEPLLLVIVAGMVMVLALGIFLPMWGMLDIIKSG
ncbi:type II secretion system F family protein [Vibrio sagamiensis]|uniref:MSHA biogenesis protein MshG n=1 Tax=Vibrio sagamiensis NBRC 104589 TaxID=1219064 RepID=A0A511QF63_9VIBR|nr:type II secretion system F family protein [Vibrio sagamiensis]PNQ69849.1 type II secretion system F family protein [Vibrio agarivorans]GEM75944.1 MSHA biogenesis protein MshG [Vibrio sagamiensis NBRC 104589]